VHVMDTALAILTNHQSCALHEGAHRDARLYLSFLMETVLKRTSGANTRPEQISRMLVRSLRSTDFTSILTEPQEFDCNKFPVALYPMQPRQKQSGGAGSYNSYNHNHNHNHNNNNTNNTVFARSTLFGRLPVTTTSAQKAHRSLSWRFAGRSFGNRPDISGLRTHRRLAIFARRLMAFRR
jgi:hypothetical protein